MSKYANLQNKDSDALYYEKESVLTRTAINNTFLGADGYSNNTVTANLLPLAMHIAPEDKINTIQQTLIRTITEKNDTCLSAGIIGIQWLMRYLSDSGHSDIAWKLATTDRYPSWGYMVSKGATTIWELWNGDTASPEMNSGNHVMLLGDLLPWCYEYIGGIRPLENGFRRILLKPDFSIPQLNHVDCSHPSPYGVIKSKWDRTGHHILWTVQIPANTSAEVCFPNGKIKKVESGSYTFEWKSE
jgi:alpha-L-rhamnosidase